MQIRTKLTEADFIQVNFVLLWRRPALKISIGIILLVNAYSIYMQIVYGTGLSPDMIIWPAMILLVLPLITFIGAKMNYRSNARIKENIEYIFDNDDLEIKGESFSSRLTWEKIHKVTKTKNWILIWQSRQVANVIPLRDIWEGDITMLKDILNRHQVKNNL